MSDLTNVDFDGLMASVAEARAYAKGEKIPGLRVHHFPAIDIAAIRKKTGATQDGFARQIGVSTATLRNWEQGRRQPTGAARVLLRVAAKHPKAVLEGER
jgi:putative transcriptional regulator